MTQLAVKRSERWCQIERGSDTSLKPILYEEVRRLISDLEVVWHSIRSNLECKKSTNWEEKFNVKFLVIGSSLWERSLRWKPLFHPLGAAMVDPPSNMIHGEYHESHYFAYVYKCHERWQSFIDVSLWGHYCKVTILTMAWPIIMMDYINLSWNVPEIVITNVSW